MSYQNAGKWFKPMALMLLMPALLLALHYLPLAPGAKAWLATLGGLATCLAALVNRSPWFKVSLLGALAINVLVLARLNQGEWLLPLLGLLYEFVCL